MNPNHSSPRTLTQRPIHPPPIIANNAPAHRSPRHRSQQAAPPIQHAPNYLLQRMSNNAFDDIPVRMRDASRTRPPRLQFAVEMTDDQEIDLEAPHLVQELLTQPAGDADLNVCPVFAHRERTRGVRGVRDPLERVFGVFADHGIGVRRLNTAAGDWI